MRGRAAGRKARETFKTMAAAVATLPVELQRVALKDEMRSAIEIGDFDGASDDLDDFETIGVPHEMEPAHRRPDGPARRGARPQGGRARRLSHGGRFLGPSGRGARHLARGRAALPARRPQARRRHFRARIADHDLARRRDRNRSAQGFGASVHRGRPLPRRLLCHAQRHGGAPGFGPDAADPGRGGGDLRRAVSHQQRRHHAGHRCAGFVLRLSRADPDRRPRRRDDPAARRPLGVGRSARSSGRFVAIPGRSPLAGRRPGAGGDAACGHLSDGPQARPRLGDVAGKPHRRPVQRFARPAAACSKRARCPTSAATSSASK